MDNSSRFALLAGILIAVGLVGQGEALFTGFNDFQTRIIEFFEDEFNPRAPEERATVEKPNVLPSLVDLAKQLKLTTFVKALEDTGLDHLLNHEGTFTLFVPNDEAFKNEKFYPNEATGKEKLKFHIGKGKILAKDIVDENTIKTMLTNRTIRFNIYPNGKVTANGRPIISTDHIAHNGVIHILSSVMSAVYAKEGSVISEIDDCCPQHSDLIDLVKVSGLYNLLDKAGPFTFFAPLNGAFDKLHPDFIHHLKKNVTALRTVILGHVVPLTWYSPGFQDGQFVKTVIGNKLNVGVQKDKVLIDKATVTLADITAKNGVIHSIDEVLFPEFPGHVDDGRHKRILKHLVNFNAN